MGLARDLVLVDDAAAHNGALVFALLFTLGVGGLSIFGVLRPRVAASSGDVVDARGTARPCAVAVGVAAVDVALWSPLVVHFLDFGLRGLRLASVVAKFSDG